MNNSDKNNHLNYGEVTQVFDSMIAETPKCSQAPKSKQKKFEAPKKDLKQKMKEKINEIKNQVEPIETKKVKFEIPAKAVVYPPEVQASIAPMVIRQGRRSRLRYDKQTLVRKQSPPFDKLIIVGENSTSLSRKGEDLRSVGRLSRKIEQDITSKFSKEHQDFHKNLEMLKKDLSISKINVMNERVRQHRMRQGRASAEHSEHMQRHLSFRRFNQRNIGNTRRNERLSVKSSGMIPRRSRISRPSELNPEIRPASPITTKNSFIQVNSPEFTHKYQKPHQVVEERPPLPKIRIQPQYHYNQNSPMAQLVVQPQQQPQASGPIMINPHSSPHPPQIPKIQQKQHHIQVGPMPPTQAPPHIILSNPSSSHSSPHPMRIQSQNQIIHHQVPPQGAQIIHPPHPQQPQMVAPQGPQIIPGQPNQVQMVPHPQAVQVAHPHPNNVNFLTRSHFQNLYHGLMQQNGNLQQQLHQMDAKYNSIANRLIGEVNTNKIKLKNEEIERRIQSQNYERQRSVDHVNKMREKQFEAVRDKRIENLEQKIKGLMSELKVKSEINKVMKMRGIKAAGNKGQDLVNENIRLKAQIQSLKTEKNEISLNFETEKDNLLNAVVMLKQQLGNQLSNNNQLRDRLIEMRKGENFDQIGQIGDIVNNEENFRILKENCLGLKNENLILTQQIEEFRQVVESMKKLPQGGDEVNSLQKKVLLLNQKLNSQEKILEENQNLKKMLEISDSKWNQEMQKALESQRKDIENYYKKMLLETKEDLESQKMETKMQKSMLEDQVKNLMHSNAKLHEANHQLAQEMNLTTHGNPPQMVNPETQVLRIENQKLKNYTKQIEKEVSFLKKLNVDDKSAKFEQYSQRIKISEEQSRELLKRVAQLEEENLELAKLKEILKQKEAEIEKFKHVNVSE